MMNFQPIAIQLSLGFKFFLLFFFFFLFQLIFYDRPRIKLWRSSSQSATQSQDPDFFCFSTLRGMAVFSFLQPFSHLRMGQNESRNIFDFFRHTVKLGYNDHGYNEFTAITNNNYRHFWSHLASLLHRSSRL